MSIQVISNAERAWQPHEKQEKIIQLPFKVFEACYGGAVGGGKSELLYMLPIVYGFHEQPTFHGVLFRESYPQLEESLILRAVPIYKLIGGTYDAQKHVFNFTSGARIKFSYVSNLKEAWDHDTNEYQYLGFDELTHFLYPVYSYLTSRVRSLISGVPPLIRVAAVPGNQGHLWVRQRFIEPDPEGLGKALIYDKEMDTYRAFIKATAKDNPHLLKKDPGYFKRLNILSQADYRAKVLGDWWTFAGQVFTEWRDQFFGVKFPDEPENASHVIEDYIPPSYLPRIIGCDWGFYPGKTWVGWAAATPDRRAILYRERVWQKTNISTWGSEVAQISQNEHISSGVLDPSAWGHRGESKTIAEQIIEATGINFQPADNDRIGGKELFHEYLRWQPKPPNYMPEQGYDESTAFSILRNVGPAAYKEYVGLFEPPEEEKNLPKLQVCKSCVEFRKVIPACVYPEDDGKGNIKKEDVQEFTGDDAYDGGRYLLKEIDRYFREAGQKHEKFSSLSAIVERLDKTNDWTTYNRQMAMYEQKYTKRVQSVSRNRRYRLFRRMV